MRKNLNSRLKEKKTQKPQLEKVEKTQKIN